MCCPHRLANFLFCRDTKIFVWADTMASEDAQHAELGIRRDMTVLAESCLGLPLENFPAAALVFAVYTSSDDVGPIAQAVEASLAASPTPESKHPLIDSKQLPEEKGE
jgi:hypothetical protein